MGETLDIEVFNPKRSELVYIANKYRELTIAGVNDKAGYAAVDEARKDCKRKRVEIQKTGKALREDAVAFQKKVLIVEKDLVSIIDPVETVLEERLKVIDDQILMESRQLLLPGRKQKLAEVESYPEDAFLLLLDDKGFQELYLQAKTTFLERKELELKKAKEEADRTAAIEKAKAEAAEQARKEAEQRAENERLRLENEKKELERKMAEDAAKAKRDAEAAELARINAEKDAAMAAEKARLEHERAIAEAAAKAKRDAEAAELARINAEKERKDAEEAKQRETAIAEWLASCGYSAEHNADRFIIKHYDTRIDLFVLQSSFPLKRIE